MTSPPSSPAIRIGLDERMSPDIVRGVREDAAGLGLAILPLESATPHAGAGRLTRVTLEESWALRRFVIVTRGQHLISAAARLLAQRLHEAADPQPQAAS